MAYSLSEHMYPTGKDIGDILAQPYVAQFRKLYNSVSHLLMTADGDQTKQRAPNKQNNIPQVPADTVSEGGSVDEYATRVFASSAKTAYIDPRGWIGLFHVAFNDILPTVNASTPRLWIDAMRQTCV
jgi:hypothetical protein